MSGNKITVVLTDPLQPMEEIESCHYRIDALIECVADLVERIFDATVDGQTCDSVGVRRAADRAATLLVMTRELVGRAQEQTALEYRHLLHAKLQMQVAA